MSCWTRGTNCKRRVIVVVEDGNEGHFSLHLAVCLSLYRVCLSLYIGVQTVDSGQ